jgi:hypothetical protein
MPKWASPERQTYLVKLFTESGSKCLQGHVNCPMLEHYAHIERKPGTIAKAVDVRCYDASGNTLKDKDGNALYLTVYQSQPIIEAEQTFVTQYELLSEIAIDGWKADTRQQSNLDWQAEARAMHSLGERKSPLRGRFSNISQDIWHDQQPLFYVECLGMSGITLTPFAKVKLSSSYMRLFVDLGDCLRSVSKNKRRKAVRYGKPLPKSVDNRIADKVWQAVKHYLNY